MQEHREVCDAEVETLINDSHKTHANVGGLEFHLHLHLLVDTIHCAVSRLTSCVTLIETVSVSV